MLTTPRMLSVIGVSFGSDVDVGRPFRPWAIPTWFLWNPVQLGEAPGDG